MNIIFSVSHLATVFLLFLAPASEPDRPADTQEPPFVLFQPYEGEDSPPTHDDPEIIGSSYVMLNEFREQTSLQLTTLEGETISVRKEFIDVHPNGSRSWVGRIDGSNWGYTILTVTDGVLWGKIYTEEHKQYHIVPVEGKPYYELRKVDASKLEEEACHNLRQLSEEPGDVDPSRANPSVCNSGSTCGPDTVMMLVVYTASARQNMGGHSSMQSGIASAVSEMNLINSNSNVIHTFLLAHAEEVNYNESGLGTDLTRLTDTDDGYIDNVHNLRNQHYADLVSLVVGSGGCGVGWLNYNPSNYSDVFGFHVVSNYCMTSNLTLAHEAGHNMGLNHDRYVYSPPDEQPCAWAYGYVNQNAPGGGPSNNWRTVMAYNKQCVDWGFNCSRIPYWSNPDVSYLGDPMGVAIGDPDEANAAYLLNRAICVVSSFREPPCTGCMIYTQCENYVPGTSSGVPTPIDVVDSFVSASAQSDNIEICVFTQGDHGSILEVFNILDEDGVNRGLTNSNGVDCAEPTSRVCFDVSSSLYNDWIADGVIHFELDPFSNNIDPNLCSINRACVEVLFPSQNQAPVCSPGGFYSGAGANPEPLPSGTYHYQDSVTLANYVVETGSDVIIKAELGIRLTSTFVVEVGGNLNTVIEPCP